MILVWLDISLLISNSGQCFFCMQLIFINHSEQAVALVNLFCSVPEVEGWVWHVAGVPQPSDLNSICPHAKWMNASEGEWHLAWDNRAHAQSYIHTHPKHSVRKATVNFSRNRSNLQPWPYNVNVHQLKRSWMINLIQTAVSQSHL